MSDVVNGNDTMMIKLSESSGDNYQQKNYRFHIDWEVQPIIPYDEHHTEEQI